MQANTKRQEPVVARRQGAVIRDSLTLGVIVGGAMHFRVDVLTQAVTIQIAAPVQTELTILP